MGSRGHRDPTAETAIGNVMKGRQFKTAQPQGSVPVGPRSPSNKWSALDGLLPHEARAASRKALALADNNLDAITRAHIEQARRDLFDGPGDAA